MKVLTGRVVAGKVEVPADLAEGTAVTILAPEAEGYRPSAQEETELSQALSAIRNGDFVDGRSLLAELKGSRA